MAGLEMAGLSWMAGCTVRDREFHLLRLASDGGLLLASLKELTATGKTNKAPGGKNEPVWPRSKRPRACGAGRTGRAGAHPVLSFRVIHISFFFMFSISPLLLLRLF
ncbi:hypothetical protein [Klebsiella grimontii]|uniref:hypothetical protein n=1 Tax=Klebsiella grimontii TaxID=2058152 RepID=UPI001404395F|nr:hypothetical protein [Klebsiella grimontii]